MSSLADALSSLLSDAPIDLARAALMIGRVESPQLDLGPSLARLESLGAQAEARLALRPGMPVRERVAVLNDLLFTEEGFRGNAARYDDVRNGLLHVVLERRLGIPITLAVVYMTVARRAGLEVFGVSFPGHFLLRVPLDAGNDTREAIILDPFDAGRELQTSSLQRLLARHTGPDVSLSPRLLAPCSSRQIIVRMLNNLKRLYVQLRSFPHAFEVTDALVSLGGGDRSDLRDRGLLAYHLDDVRVALRDLEAYLETAGHSAEDSDEERQIREHVLTLRRRVAGMN